MARPQSVDEATLIERLRGVFRDYGFQGASLSQLSKATGLRRASLYHRFPGGKEDMARAVLAASRTLVAERILNPLLDNSTPPRKRLETCISALDEVYEGGLKSCLLQAMSEPTAPCQNAVAASTKAWLEALAAVLKDAGASEETARHRALRGLAQIQGGLVLARALGDPAAYRELSNALPDEMLAGLPE
jgi:TetR/AcrR family transcriptional repressor of lmrAB and yxaGH operons